mmetsp:Transcript_2302/g.3214  ORF Transcript_2302/g.3214 Transcript_2302/m.3214 type:complete len:185 (-) Transcript_2302:114-668(-)
MKDEIQLLPNLAERLRVQPNTPEKGRKTRSRKRKNISPIDKTVEIPKTEFRRRLEDTSDIVIHRPMKTLTKASDIGLCLNMPYLVRAPKLVDFYRSLLPIKLGFEGKQTCRRSSPPKRLKRLKNVYRNSQLNCVRKLIEIRDSSPYKRMKHAHQRSRSNSPERVSQSQNLSPRKRTPKISIKFS